MRRQPTTLVLLGLLVLLFVVPFAVGSQRTSAEEPFAGADAQAEGVIGELDADYEPWFAPLFEPASGEIESGLFAVQAGAGGLLFGYVLGRLHGRSLGRRGGTGRTAAEGTGGPRVAVAEV